MKSTDFGPSMPLNPQTAWLEQFAAECQRTPAESLARWLGECPEDDPAYPIIRAALTVKTDALMTEVRAATQQPPYAEDDLSCFDGPAEAPAVAEPEQDEQPDKWESWDWDRLREQRRIEFVADQHDPAEEGL